jgi:hypothetical protein
VKPIPTPDAPTVSLTSPALASLALLVVLSMAACSSAPKAANWQVEAKGAMDRSVAAYLEGNDRVAAAERVRARQQLASTGRADFMATAELLHCAARVASLVFEPCSGFEALRPDATPAQGAYANYLRGRLDPAQIALLPTAQQEAAGRRPEDGRPLMGIDDPLSLLVAAGVLLESGKANPATIDQAVETASGQGWRRPLLAWLGVQAERARQAGQTAEVQRLKRRMARVQGGPDPIN